MKWPDVVTMATDFGHKGPSSAVMRGRNPTAQISHLADDIPPQSPPEAGFWIRRAYSCFPAGSIHFAIVDPGD